MARSSLVGGGLDGATALLMNALFGMSFQTKPSETKGRGSARWYAISTESNGGVREAGGELREAERLRVGFSGKSTGVAEEDERLRGGINEKGIPRSSRPFETVLGCGGTSPLAAQGKEVDSPRAISANELKTGGLDEDGPAAAGLNQPNGAAIFLLLSVRCCGLKTGGERQFTAW